MSKKINKIFCSNNSSLWTIMIRAVIFISLLGFILLFMSMLPEKLPPSLFFLSYYLLPFGLSYKLQLFSFLIYALLVGFIIFSPLGIRLFCLKKNNLWSAFFLLLFLVSSKIFVFQHSTMDTDHPDWASFEYNFVRLHEFLNENLQKVTIDSNLNLSSHQAHSNSFLNKIWEIKNIYWNANNPPSSHNSYGVLASIESAYKTQRAGGIKSFKDMSPFGELLFTYNMYTHKTYIPAGWPLPSLLYGFFGHLGRVSLEKIGYRPYWTAFQEKAFIEYGRIVSPLWGAILILLFIGFGRRFIFNRNSNWSWHLWVILFFSFIPVHIFMGSAISYNMLADMLLMMMVFANFSLMQNWLLLETKSERTEEKIFIKYGILWSVSFGLLLSTKNMYPSILIVGIIQLIGIAIFYFLKKTKNKWQSLAILLLFLFLLFSIALVTYLLIALPFMNFHPLHYIFYSLSLLKASAELSWNLLEGCKTFFFQLLIPNLGVPLSFAGLIGLFIFIFNSFKRRNILQCLISFWIVLVLLPSLIHRYFSTDQAAMTRNTFSLSIVVFFAVFFLDTFLQKIDSYFSNRFPRRIFFKKIIKIALFSLLLIPFAARGISSLVFFAGDSPKTKAKNYLLAHVKSGEYIRSVIVSIYSWYPLSHPSTIEQLSRKGVQIIPPLTIKNMTDVSSTYQIIQILSKNSWRFDTLMSPHAPSTPAANDYFVIGSHDSFFLPRKEQDMNDLRIALVAQGYKLASHLEPDFLKSKIFNNYLQNYYKSILQELLANGKTGGLWSPYSVDIFLKKSN